MQRHWENCTTVSTMCGAGILYDEQTPQALAVMPICFKIATLGWDCPTAPPMKAVRTTS
jgi:hypothetical protein